MEEVKAYFLNHQDNTYALMNKKLNLAVKNKSLGVRIPLIRSLAKTLTKKYDINYLLNNIDDELYEEILLKGFIIGNYKNLTFNELLFYIDNHLTKVSDWSMCDTFVSSLKITTKYLDELWLYLLKKMQSKKEFDVRFALVMMLDYYINNQYKERIYDAILMVKNDEYYVKMANAWLISYMLMAYFDDTVLFLQKAKLDKWTIAKGIAKAIESRQINIKQKEDLRKLRNKINNK